MTARPKPVETYVPERGYHLGPDLPAGERAWPIRWEPVVNDDCLHVWERVTIQRPGLDREAVVRCRACHVPRCGDSDERDPCMERRHHNTVHLRLLGEFAPVGGYLREETRDA